MNLKLTRSSCYSWGIVSVLTDEQGLLSLLTLEHAYLMPKGLYAAKIPNGIYNCVLGTHQLLHGDPFETYEVTGVPHHSNILFHKGNYNSDSEGCILLGESLGDQCILSSKEAFDQFMTFQADASSFSLTVS